MISSQKDFYDGASGYYSDDFVWRRNSTILKDVFIYDLPSDLVEWLKSLDARLYIAQSTSDGRSSCGCASHYILFVAGRAYPIFTNCDLIKLQGALYNIQNDDDAMLIYADRSGVMGKKMSLRGELFKWNKPESDVDDVLTQYLAVEGTRVGDALHIKYGEPIILVKLDRHFYPKSRYDIMLNPNLSLLFFYKKLDAFTTHQEIEQYMTNVLTPVDKNVVTVGDDVVIARQKGFDDQSFRTRAPGVKKENRKANRLRKKQRV